MPLAGDAGTPSHWLVYFGSESVDDDAGRVGELGGTVIVAADVGPGRAHPRRADPQGGVFALFDGPVRRLAAPRARAAFTRSSLSSSTASTRSPWS